jgi:hypothetical protein
MKNTSNKKYKVVAFDENGYEIAYTYSNDGPQAAADLRAIFPETVLISGYMAEHVIPICMNGGQI